MSNFKTATQFPAKFILLLLFSYILLTPSFDLLPSYGMYNEKRILECLILLIAVALLLIDKTLSLKWIGTFTTLPILVRYSLFAIFIIGLLSAANAPQAIAAFLDVALYTLIFIAIILVAAIQQLITQKKFEAFFLITLLASTAIYLTTFFSGQIAASLEPVPLLHQSLFANFSHLRFFGQFQSWTLPLIVLPLLLVPRLPRSLKILTLIIAASWWYLLFTSGTRGSMFGLIIAFAAVAIAFGRHALPWFKWQGVAIVAGLLIYITLFFILPAMTSSDSSTVLKNTVGRELAHSTGRFKLWEKAGQMIVNEPFLGVGPSHYGCDLSNHIAAHPHNSILQIAAEWGLPVAILITGITLFSLLRWIQRGRVLLSTSPQGSNQSRALLYPTLLASLVAAGTHSLFSGVIIMPLSQIMMIIVIGWMIAVYQAATDKQKPILSTQNGFRLALTALVLLSSGILIYATVPDIFHLFELQGAFQSEHPTTRVLPRFWQQGRICG